MIGFINEVFVQCDAGAPGASARARIICYGPAASRVTSHQRGVLLPRKFFRGGFGSTEFVYNNDFKKIFYNKFHVSFYTPYNLCVREENLKASNIVLNN